MMIMYIEAYLRRVEKTWAHSEKKSIYGHVLVELLLVYIDSAYKIKLWVCNKASISVGTSAKRRNSASYVYYGYLHSQKSRSRDRRTPQHLANKHVPLPRPACCLS